MSTGSFDRYGGDVLKQPAAGRQRRPLPAVEATQGLVVEDAESGWCGAIVRVEVVGGVAVVELADRHGKVRSFPLGPGFWIDGKPVDLVRPAPRQQQPTGPLLSRSGSRAVVGEYSRTARASRIWVEGHHDAELLAKIWGHDLGVEAVLVEAMGGIDRLAEAVAVFNPGPGRRLGVLVDHLVDGTKESRIAADAIASMPGAEHVLIVGHPYVDVWQAVKPSVLGIDVWPTIPRGQDWKRGILRHLGWPHESQTDVAEGFRKILSKVNRYTDLEASFLGPVEQLIDHVTTDPADQ